MSLKAKLEAVIYAAEEPVTLNQLAMLFAEEALEWRAEQEQAAAATKASTPIAEPLPFINRDLGYVELEQADGATVEDGVDLSTTAEPAEATEHPTETELSAQPEADAPAADVQDQPAAGGGAAEAAAEALASEAAGASAETGAEASADAAPEISAEEAAKQAARQRDREVRLILRELLDELVEDYSREGSGIEIREIAGGYRMATKPEYHDAVRAFVKSMKPALKLSLPALETLAVIAYKQPVTAPEVNEIRGVDSSGVFGSLLARKLIATAGRKQVVGRPILYKTTKEFLLRFGLKELNELPSMEEFEKMAASELEETETVTTEPESTTGQPNEAADSGETASAENADESPATDPAIEAPSASEALRDETPETTLE